MPAGKGNMGISKHRRSGTPSHSPRFVVNRQLEIDDECQKASKIRKGKSQLQKTADSVGELFGHPKPKRKKHKKKK